jgi:cyclic beta-1,2-glucan synthetase
VAPHAGRGGWTWYTGAAGWLYRAGIEAILGFRQQGTSLLLSPCVPGDWPGYEIVFRHHATRYEIVVEKHGDRVTHAELDGETLPARPVRIPLLDDGRTHAVRVILS